MADPEDKLLGVRINGSNTTRVLGAFRIDYDDSRTLSEIIGLDEFSSLSDEYSGTVKFIGQTAIDRGYHSVKSGYQFKVLVDDATTRDEVQSDLDAEGISYTTEDVTPSKEMRLGMEACGVMTDTQMPAVQEWYNDVKADWDEAVADCENGDITESQLKRGYNPHRGKNIPVPQELQRA